MSEMSENRDRSVLTIKDLEETVRRSGSEIGGKKNYSKAIIENVCDIFIDGLKLKVKDGKTFDANKKPFIEFEKVDIKDIAEKLIIGNAFTEQSWRQRSCLNDLIFALLSERVIKSPFFRIPIQVERMTILHMDKELWEGLSYFQAMKEDLLNLRTGSPSDPVEKEEDLICSFVASASIFGKILFPGFEKEILRAKFKRVSLSPFFMEIPLTGSEDDDAAFYRYFLPAPAAIYFLACIMFFKKKRSPGKKRKKMKPDEFLFPEIQGRLENFPEIFRNWTIKRLHKLGFKDSKGFTPKYFKKVALLESFLQSGEDGVSSGSYPPFVISVQAREIMSDSVPRDYLTYRRHEGGKKAGIKKEKKSERRKKTDKDNPREMTETVKNAISMIYRLHYKELKTGQRLQRMEINGGIEDVRALMTSIGGSPDEAWRENVGLYLEWIIEMLGSKTALKSITSYVSNAARLIYSLPPDNPVHRLSKEKLIQVLKEMMDRYDYQDIGKGVRSFLFFLMTRFNDFKPPDTRIKELRREKIIESKPLIHLEHVSEAFGKCRNFFCRFVEKSRNKDNEQFKTKLRKAEHKSEIVYHMITLGFFAGLRVSEFLNLKLHNVIYDGGIVLTVRKTKTENGVRNIPLWRLVPESYLEKFNEYFIRRRENASSGGELLFPNFHGEKWNASHISGEVTRLFEEIGVPGINFHLLRHAFANWVLQRWFFAFHSEYLPKGTRFINNELFKSENIVKFKELFHRGESRKGQDLFTYALAVLARLIGHGGPIVTLQKYIHTVDWLFYMLSRGMEDKSVRFTAKQAEVFLQRSYPSLPKELKGRGIKKMKFRDILGLQRRYLKLAGKLTL